MTEALKTPFIYALNRHTQARAHAVQALLGKALPCTVVSVQPGPVVTVKFDVNSYFTIPQITMPVSTPEYFRMPIQVGDRGLAVPGTVAVAQASGFTSATPNLGVTGNLSTLTFQPISSKKFFAVDPNAATLYGPNGVVLEDSQKHTVLTLTPDSGVTLTMPAGQKLAITGDLTVTGAITAGFGGGDSVTVQHHEHPTAPSGPVSPPTPGT